MPFERMDTVGRLTLFHFDSAMMLPSWLDPDGGEARRIIPPHIGPLVRGRLADSLEMYTYLLLE